MTNQPQPQPQQSEPYKDADTRFEESCAFSESQIELHAKNHPMSLPAEQTGGEKRQWSLIRNTDREFLLCHPKGWVHSIIRQADGDNSYFKPRAQKIVDALNL